MLNVHWKVELIAKSVELSLFFNKRNRILYYPFKNKIMAKKYLIVGANVDSEEGYLPCLPGAENSALKWEHFLRNELHFSGECLTDKKAHGTDILEKLDHLFFGLSANDFVAFIYLGHGVQKKKENNDLGTLDETDGYNEVLYCNGNSITDNQIRAVLNKYTKITPIFILIDACNSGVVERNYNVLNSLVEYNEVAFSTSNLDLESYYLAVEDGKGKEAIFSLCLLEVLRDKLNKNYNDIFDLTVEKLRTYKNVQIPQMAFTNPTILKNTIFNCPIDDHLKFDEKEIEIILKDLNKGKTGIMKLGDDKKRETYFKTREKFDLLNTRFIKETFNKINLIIQKL